MAASSSSNSSSTTTPLLYSCIAHKTTILAEHTASPSSGASSLASIVLPKIPHTSPQKLTYTHVQNLIHYIAEGPTSTAPGSSSTFASLNSSASGLTFLVIATQSTGQSIPFGYLVEIRKRFLGQYDPSRTDFGSLPPFGCAAFNGRLKELMVSSSSTPQGRHDAIGRAKREIEDVKGIMTENIERVLERGERIDLLVDKTDRLGGSARDFRVRSRGLRRRMWWKNVRLMVLLVLVCIFLVYLVVGFGCGLPGWHKCVGHSKRKNH